jgi:hypothetical protein
MFYSCSVFEQLSAPSFERLDRRFDQWRQNLRCKVLGGLAPGDCACLGKSVWDRLKYVLGGTRLALQVFLMRGAGDPQAAATATVNVASRILIGVMSACLERQMIP